MGETLRAAVEDLADADLDGLVAHSGPAWVERDGPRADHDRRPTADAERTALAEQGGVDGWPVVQALKEPGTPEAWQSLLLVRLVQQVWKQASDLSRGQPTGRAGPQAEDQGAGIRSPDDPDARTSKKRTRIGFGSSVSLTKPCESDRPHLVVAVPTTPATVTDVEMTDPMHQDRAHRELHPEVPWVDAGSVEADVVASSPARGIRVVGPALADTRWQTRAGNGVRPTPLPLDWSTHEALCPHGQPSHRWESLEERSSGEIVGTTETCVGCPVRHEWTRAQRSGRVLPVRSHAAHQALLARRAEQGTEACPQESQTRAGSEGTLSQWVRRCGLRQASSRGLRKTPVQEVVAAVTLHGLR